MGGFVPKPLRPSAPTPPPVAKPMPVSPTAAEVSQSEATNADGTTSASRKIKRKGRSATILTSPTGVESGATLGTQSLLGG